MFIFVLFEVLVIAACIFIAKKMVEKRTGLAKRMPIGKDDQSTIEEMERLARNIILTGKLELTEEFERYDVKVKAKERAIEDVEIKSSATKIWWNLNYGWNNTSIAWTEKGAIAQIAVILWIVLVAIQVAVAVIALLLWARTVIT